MFDFARAIVVAIASAQASVCGHRQEPGAATGSSSHDPFELPRFLTLPDPRASVVADVHVLHLFAAWAKRAAGLSAVDVLLRASVSEVRQRAGLLRERLAQAYDACRDAVLAGDRGLITIFSIAVLILLFLAGSAPGSNVRNPRADAIAARFAAASAEGDLAEIEERLDFAPRFAIALSARQPGTVQIALAKGSPSRVLPFDALGVIILRGLPVGSSLSSGLAVGEGQWVVAQGDLDNLEVSIPNLAKATQIEVDVVSRGGAALGSLAFTLTPMGLAEAKFDGSSPIRTGALSVPPALDEPKEDGARLRDARRPNSAPRAKRKSVPSHTLKAAPNAVKLQFKPVAASQKPVPGSPLLLFTPAGETVAKAPKPAVKRQASAVDKSSAFPRSPMEEEAARR